MRASFGAPQRGVSQQQARRKKKKLRGKEEKRASKKASRFGQHLLRESALPVLGELGTAVTMHRHTSSRARDQGPVATVGPVVLAEPPGSAASAAVSRHRRTFARARVGQEKDDQDDLLAKWDAPGLYLRATAPPPQQQQQQQQQEQVSRTVTRAIRASRSAASDAVSLVHAVPPLAVRPPPERVYGHWIQREAGWRLVDERYDDKPELLVEIVEQLREHVPDYPQEDGPLPPRKRRRTREPASEEAHDGRGGPATLPSCVICTDKPVEFIFEGCRHVLLCTACAKYVETNLHSECPTCRKRSRLLPVYIG
jgi:Zinc finger, C3HC4 type (RING finger)